MNKILRKYEEYKIPLIEGEEYTLEEWYINSGYNFLAEYLSFIDFTELVVVLVIVRFFFSWRLILFVYLGYILLQIYFSYSVVNANYKTNSDTNLPLAEKIVSLLSSLLLPFGNLILSKLKESKLFLLNGGGGLFITNSNISIGKRTFTTHSDKPDFTQFTKDYMEKYRHPKISSNLVDSYANSFKVFNFDKCISLFKECNVNQAKCLMSITNEYFSKNREIIIKNTLYDKELILAMEKLYLSETNQLILAKAEDAFNVKFLIPTEKSDDLISLDSAQPLVSKPWTSTESLIKEYGRNNGKVGELLDAALTQGNQDLLTFLFNLSEQGTQADYYCANLVSSSISQIGSVPKPRYTHSDMEDLHVPFIAVDIHRKASFNFTQEGILEAIKEQKLEKFFKNCTNFPQRDHHLAVVLPAITRKEEKEFIDKEINNYIEENNSLASVPIPKLTFKSVIDTFLD